jgi:hypothetical protein
MMRSARRALQRGQIIGIKTVSPAVKGLGSNAEIPAGLPDVPTLIIVIEPSEPLGGVPGDRPLPDKRVDKVGPWNEGPIGLGRMEIHSDSYHTPPSLMYLN